MIFLKDAIFIDWLTFEFKTVNIGISKGALANISFFDKIPSNTPPQNIIDCKGKYVTKSFGCAHHHVYSALSTGMPAPYKNPDNYYEILKYIWWNLDKSLDLDIIKASAYVTAIECAKNGVTFVIDHHASPFMVENSLETIAKAFDDVGISHLLCFEISDRDGVNIAKKALNETDNYLSNGNQGLVGLHASFTLTNKTLQSATNLARKHKTGVHVHVAEDIYDQESCYDIYDKRVIERFNDFGILELPASVFVHCLYLNTHERELISKSNVHVVQNTESNLNKSSGQFNSGMLGKNIMLGTDGLHSDMLRAAKVTYFNAQMYDAIDPETIYQRFRQIHNYIKLNNFKGDSSNNLVVLDYNPVTDFNETNFLAHFIHGIDSRHVQHVISNGEIVLFDRKITKVDENEIKQLSRLMGNKLWKIMKEPKR